MSEKPSGRPPNRGILKKEVFGYAVICIILLLLLGTGGMAGRAFPVKGVASALGYLTIGGLGMSAWMFCFRSRTEQSEFFKTFSLLYHPGVWILAAASFLEGGGLAKSEVTGTLHLIYIAGGTFLVAGLIVLVIILRDGS